MRPRPLWIALLVAALSLVAPRPALAATFHEYSTVSESSAGSGYTGVSSARFDQHFTGIPSTGCSSRYSGSPVYQTQWVLLTSDAKNWRELGTGHQCNDTYRYWFWGYGSAGTWYPLGGVSNITNGSTHTFTISRSFTGTSNTYIWTIDSTNRATMTSSASGPYVQAGLESYASAASGRYSLTTLRFQRNGGTMSAWAGRDGVTVNSTMCGRWVSDTSRVVGQNVSCA
ncbi:MAG: hypothetical protein U0Q19_22330 [Kineosporiaceae bacterium]